MKTMKQIYLEEILMKKALLFVTAVTCMLLLISSAFVPKAFAREPGAQGVVGMAAVQAQGEAQADIETYWTPERLLSAKPMAVHPEVGADGLPIANKVPTHAAPFVSVAGASPSVHIGSNASKVLVPKGFKLESEPESGVTPEATSSFGAFFTTLRVFPDAATTTYPYRTVGQLFFTDPRTGGNFVCSASVLRLRVLVMAGHCVAHGSPTPSDRYFYSKFLFVPSEKSGSAPNGVWTWSFVTTTNDWFNDGSVPNQQDVGMLVMVDQRLGGGGPFKIGQITGFLGYRYCTSTNCSNPPLAHNNLTMIGYPCNLDNCARMEQTNAQNFAFGGSNTWIYGSVMRGGSSGGPWIQDFGVAPSGAPGGLLGNNFVTAVTSYGPVATSPKYLGASAFDARFFTLLNFACSHAGSGGC